MDWMFTSKWLSTTTLFHRCRVIKAAKNVSGPTLSNLQLAEEEIILDIDGTVPLQPVLQHIGISAWPGEFYPDNRVVGIYLRLGSLVDCVDHHLLAGGKSIPGMMI
ncbi:hypothetical protein ACJRO7_022932 [Eucalyptus globulus]|uniref:Uncharacterized protein n=1 Tax=Eucalyptus globulus TaxID=34317 RepID=A0ABD3K500_EUCGL